MQHASFSASIKLRIEHLAHLIYPGGMSQQDWAHDLPQLVKEAAWSKR
jgi:hypothetical protein